MSNIKVYLACPYSDPDPEVEKWRVEMADKAAAYLMELEYIVFSPITHSSRLSKYLGKASDDHDFWLKQDAAWLEACEELYVLRLPGWKKSFGVAWELGYAKARK
ncbi:unnamed protein product, partial [marine sediment metagenome]